MSNQAGLGIGNSVHNQEINEYPEEMRQDYLRLSDWVRKTYQVYGRQIWIKVIDPQSAVGLWKHLRYRIRRYPTVVLDGKHRYVGWDALPQVIQQVETLIAARRDPSIAGS